MSADALQQFRAAAALHQQGRLAEAASAYERVLTINPRHADALHLLGVIALQGGQVERGAELISRSLSVRPDHPEALCNLGNAYRQLGQPGKAVPCYDRAIQLNPRLIDAHANRGGALLNMGQAQAALQAFDAVLKLKPDHPEAYANRGAALQILKRMDEALAAFDRAIALRPKMPEAHANRGNILRELGRLDEALAACDSALKLRPNYLGAHIFRGFVLQEIGRSNDALNAFDAAIAINANDARALLGRGRALFNLGRGGEAVASYDASLARAPENSQGHFHRAIALAELGRHEEAVAGATRALELSPDLHGAYVLRANALLDLGRMEESLRDHATLVRIAPDIDYALGHYLHAKATLCDWEGIADLRETLRTRIEAGERAAYPFVMLGQFDSPELLLRCAKLHAATERPVVDVQSPLRASGPDRIKIAYFSSDFWDHPAAHLVAGTLAHHDRERFEVYAYSFATREDAVTERIRQSVDQFVDVSALTTSEIVDRARADGVDVAIDLNGYTKLARTRIFATRVAPVQIGYLGYLGTMGAPFMDYLIADPVLIPGGERAHYAEKLMLLPWYQCNDESSNAPGAARTRADYGLPEDAFVFCSFNSSFKITPELFASWMRMLQRVPRSVLWLYAGNAVAARNLAAAAETLGVGSDRIVFAQSAPRAEHLARQQLAGLMLDTSPYNGGATSSNALRAGVPVLTLSGRTFSSRMGASLLSALDLPELIATSLEEYEERAVAFASDAQALNEVKRKIGAAPLSNLFSAAAIARYLERAYAIAVACARSGEEPADIVIEGE